MYIVIEKNVLLSNIHKTIEDAIKMAKTDILNKRINEELCICKIDIKHIAKLGAIIIDNPEEDIVYTDKDPILCTKDNEKAKEQFYDVYTKHKDNLYTMASVLNTTRLRTVTGLDWNYSRVYNYIDHTYRHYIQKKGG